LGDLVDQNDSLLGLGGSAWLQCLHGLKTGLPPRCDLEKERALHHAVRGFIACGLVRSAHDCSEGGLAVTLAESCISQQIARDTPRLIGAQIDLSAAPDNFSIDSLLFGETQGRVIISIAPLDEVKVLGRAKILGVSAIKLGTIGGSELVIKRGAAEWKWPLAQLHDAWWNAIARAMK
jgi:phosphoribosylformylglycinamidine synthase